MNLHLETVSTTPLFGAMELDLARKYANYITGFVFTFCGYPVNQFGFDLPVQVLEPERTTGVATVTKILNAIPEVVPQRLEDYANAGINWIKDQFIIQRKVVGYEMYKNLAEKNQKIMELGDLMKLTL